MTLTRLVHIITVPATLSLMRGQLGFSARSGFDVHLVSSFGGRVPPSEEGAHFHSVGMKRALSPIDDLSSLARLASLLRELRPDIVQAGTPKAALLGMMAARLVGAPIRIYHIRGLDHLAGTRGRALAAETAERACCALATHVLCVSPSVRENLLREGICPPEKAHVLLRGSSNGVDARGRFDPEKHAGRRAELRQSLGIPLEAIVIGFVGRLVRDKGIEVLLEAWQRLRIDFPAAELLLVGPFEKGDSLPTQVRERLTRDPRIKITQTDWGQAAPLYAAMDVVGFPSLREGFPNVPLEAAAMGLPVVAARVVGSRDAVVDGETGLLVPPRAPLDLAEALASLMRDPALARGLGAAGRSRVLADYRPDDLWQAQVDWYKALLAAR